MFNSVSVLERAGAWFLNSGIQEPQGGVARYYRSDTGKNARVSTEITGYAVSFLVFLYQRSGCRDYLDAAIRAGRFLIAHAWDAQLGVFPFEHSFNGSRPDALTYFFDSGMIVRGLLTLWRATEDRQFLSAAVSTGCGMLAFESGADIHPILVLPKLSALPYEARWSASPGCYQLKSAMAWSDLFEATGEPSFGRAYHAALGRALGTNTEFLPGHVDREKVMDRLHAYAYFLEGLLPCAQRRDCATALRTGIASVAHRLRDIAPDFVRSDVYAQVLRMRLYAHHAGILPIDTEAASHEAREAAGFQFDSGEAAFSGGFGFGRRAGVMLPFVNPVSTAFCAQALAGWQDHQAGVFSPDRLALV